MTDFSDVERFTLEHRACGGVTPSVSSPRPDGYLLTLTCRCAATFDRRVTAEDAKLLPFGGAVPGSVPADVPPPAATVAPAPQRRAPTPNPDFEAAVREALEAEAKPAPRPSPRRTAANDDVQAALRAAMGAESERAAPLSPPTPRGKGDKHAPSPELEAVLRQAIAAPDPDAPPTSAPATPARVSPAKLDVSNTVNEALRQRNTLLTASQPRSTIDRPRTARRWVLVAGMSIIAATAALWFANQGPDVPASNETESAQRQSAAKPADGSVTAEAAVASLRRLQSAIGPQLSLPSYETQLAGTRTAVAPFVDGEPPGAAQTTMREIIDLHLLATAAWRARSLGTREAWESLSRSSAVDLCPAAKETVEAADPDRAKPDARGRATASAIPSLWECAARRLNELERKF